MTLHVSATRPDDLGPAPSPMDERPVSGAELCSLLHCAASFNARVPLLPLMWKRFAPGAQVTGDCDDFKAVDMDEPHKGPANESHYFKGKDDARGVSVDLPGLKASSSRFPSVRNVFFSVKIARGQSPPVSRPNPWFWSAVRSCEGLRRELTCSAGRRSLPGARRLFDLLFGCFDHVFGGEAEFFLHLLHGRRSAEGFHSYAPADGPEVARPAEG